MILSFVLEQGKDIPIPANPLFQPFHFQKQQQALIIESSAAMERNDSHARKQSASKRHAKFDFSQSTATHFTSESEIAAYINWINTQLASDTDLAEHLPIPLGKENALFEACNDGLLLCKLINNSVPTTIPEKVINKKPKSIIHRHENLQRALAGAVKIGVQVHNLSAEDLLQGTPHLCLGLIWQVIKIGLLQNVSPVGPESAHNSTQDMPSKADPSTQSLERALLKWVNGTLARLDAPVRIGNFGTDLSDSVALAFLIASFDDSDAKAREILAEADILKRAERTLEYAARFDCRHFASAGDIVGGNKNLNLAFVAVLHNLKVAREKNAAVRIELEGAKEDAEAKLLRVASSKDVELKRLKMQLQDMTEDAERLKEERDALETELNDYKVAAEGQEEYSAQADMLRTQLAGLEEELRASKKLNETVTSSFESLTHTVSEVYSAKEDLEKKLQSSRQNITNELPALQGQLNAANLKIMELEMENQMLRENLADLRYSNCL
ncbi:calponin homology domain-containing protein [Chytriomyces sp. MP71]|nr:calponin homology domain-containing protein [Chytriomyces sp. MP71]